jgi:hypothetical protein
MSQLLYDGPLKATGIQEVKFQRKKKIPFFFVTQNQQYGSRKHWKIWNEIITPFFRGRRDWGFFFKKRERKKSPKKLRIHQRNLVWNSA